MLSISPAMTAIERPSATGAGTRDPSGSAGGEPSSPNRSDPLPATANAAEADARRAASTTSRPSANPAASPPQNASPAPVGSTTDVGTDGIRHSPPSGSATRHPSAPSFATSGVPVAPANDGALRSGSSNPASSASSSRDGQNTATRAASASTRPASQ